MGIIFTKKIQNMKLFALIAIGAQARMFDRVERDGVECGVERVTCKENEVCESDLCVCKDPFEAVGDECVPKDPCIGVTCDEHSSCVAPKGECECDEGSQPQGQFLVCEPVPEVPEEPECTAQNVAEKCQAGQTCENGVCTDPSTDPEPPKDPECTEENVADKCAEGETCEEGVCTPPAGEGDKDEDKDTEGAAAAFSVGAALFALIMA